LPEGLRKAILCLIEAAPGSAGTSDGGGHPKSRDRFSSPLQAKPISQNWDWQSVIGINQGACEELEHSME